jgi:hypothetical protein
MPPPSLFMVFDVESIGLHGQGFAVGWVVVNRMGVELEANRLACNPIAAAGDKEGREWVAANVPPIPVSRLDHMTPELAEMFAIKSPGGVRYGFWSRWLHWKGQGAVLAADCCWPVEARFLVECVEDDPVARRWLGPYPLIDIASIRLAKGLDPLGTEERRPDELPVHDPLADARQSARLLIEALNHRTEAPLCPASRWTNSRTTPGPSAR